jgi:hypothetical protein
MKKIFTILLLCFLVIETNAQITITLNDLPNIGNTLWQASDSTGSPALTGSLTGGASQTWNFAGGWEVGDSTKITFAPTTSVSNSISSQFPSANLAYDQVEDSTALFFIRNSTGLHLAGNFLYGTIDIQGLQITNVATVFSQPEMLVPVPMAYNDNATFNSYSVTTVNATIPPFGAVTIYQYQGKTKVFDCIGYGSLTTPSGTYSNTLMGRYTITSYDTTFTSNPILGPQINSDTVSYSTEYFWVTNDPDQLILLQITADSAGTVMESANYSFKTTTSNHPDYLALSSVSFYPVPTTGLVNISVPQVLSSGEMKIYNLNGEEIPSLRASFQGNTTLDLSSLNNGVYLLEIQSGEFVRTGKITVAK